ncbi:MAG: FAD-dependent oxidoreductase, partial [Kangiellaceae bacterium]|nr:FAD-dependent oxidoreductase [Kangiellaceae bacterium]
DAAIQAKRLGAANVTLVYRRNEQSMSATEWEVDLARRNDVKIVLLAVPDKYDPINSTITFKRTVINDGELRFTDESFDLPADLILTAIGQKLEIESVIDQQIEQKLEIMAGKIVVSESYETSLNGVFAGGDCIQGDDLTVQAVQDGKQAAHSIHDYIMEQG